MKKTRDVKNNRFRKLALICMMISMLVGIIAMSVIAGDASSYYTIRINYLYPSGSPAHDPYIATYDIGDAQSYNVSSPTVNGFAPVVLKDGCDVSDLNDYLADPESAAEEPYTAAAEVAVASGGSADATYTVYYVPGLSHYAARYYLQNVYDDLYTLDRPRTNANTYRLGKTGTAPDDLESEKIPGFTSLFHEPDAIAGDGSTVFRVYYDRNYYSIYFNLGDGGYGVEPIYAKYETSYRIEQPKREGYTFLGWARTSGDSSKGEEGEDWFYIPDDLDTSGWTTYDAHNNEIFEPADSDRFAAVALDAADVEATPPIGPDEYTGGTIACENRYYKAIWAPGTTHFNVVYWIENADSTLSGDSSDFVGKTPEQKQKMISQNYSALAVRRVRRVYVGSVDDPIPVTPGMTIDRNTRIRNFAQKAVDTGEVASDPYATTLKITEFFNYNLNYADPDDPRNADPDTSDPDYVAPETIYKYDVDGHIVDFNEISKAESADLKGHEKYFLENNSTNGIPDALCATDTSVVVKGDGTTTFNVFYRRKPITLKFYYVRQKLVSGNPTGDIDLTNSTKNFSKYNYFGKNENSIVAVSKGTWEAGAAVSRPQIASKYRGILTDSSSNPDGLYQDYSGYRYYYYQVVSKYNAPLKGKWLIDAIDPVIKGNKYAGNAGQTCYPGSWATEYNTVYMMNNRKYDENNVRQPGNDNFTIKGIYERLDDELLFREDRTTDYTELHFLLSWTNSSNSANGWNDTQSKVLHFQYNNYVELLPRELEIMEYDSDGDGEPDGAGALIADADHPDRPYIDVIVDRTFTDLNGDPVTRSYGLPAENRIETIDSGNQYGNNASTSASTKTSAVYSNQTAAAMTGFQLENYQKDGTGRASLSAQNCTCDWSEDTNNYRRGIINFFYHRRTYTLYYNNGNGIDADHTKTEVMYGAPLNSQYLTAERSHEIGDYRYYWPDPEYFNAELRANYSFKGWYNDPRFNEPIDLENQTMPADDDILYAKWEIKTIDVVFYSNYDKYYIDRKFNQPGQRIVLNQHAIDAATDAGEEVPDAKTYVSVPYGSYTPLSNIPINDESEENIRPVLEPIAEGASFAGWYYIRNRVPVRFEPENVPITAINEESSNDAHPRLRLYAEWVTKDVAKYRVRYVRADDPDVDVAAPTIGRAYVWKTKTFNAKDGTELYDDYKWTEDGGEDGTNWYPTTTSSSLVIKANTTEGNEYAPNDTVNFYYIQKSRVHYKVQYLDAATYEPINPGGLDVEKDTAKASVTEDAMVIPGYIARTASQSLVLTASSDPDPDTQVAEELENNVITFLYDRNTTDYLYKVEYHIQDLPDGSGGATTYSLYAEETLTVRINEGDVTTVDIADLIGRPIPTALLGNGYTHDDDSSTYTVTDTAGSVTGPYDVADDGSVTIVEDDLKTIRLYYNRKSYPVTYFKVDHSQEKLYNTMVQNGEDVTGVWNGVIGTEVSVGSFLTGETVTIDPPRTITDYTPPYETEARNYVRLANDDGTVNDVVVTVQPDDFTRGYGYNVVKVYYRTDTERELTYQMVCVNDSRDTDYYEDGTPKFGRLSMTMQTVQSYDAVANVTFHDTNNEIVYQSGDNREYLHLHKYRFLGWYSTPTYDPDHPDVGRLTGPDDPVLNKADIGESLPALDTKYYALVEQETVQMDVMFYYTDDYTVSEFRAEEDDDLQPIMQDAIDNADDPSEDNKVLSDGSYGGQQVVFTAPNGYENHTKIPWHRNDGYTLYMSPIDERIYKYEFVEWWRIDHNESDALCRMYNWNSPSIEWSADTLTQQISRNIDQYLIAVYARKSVDVPYTIYYNFLDRYGNEQTFVKTGTFTAGSDELDESSPDCAIRTDVSYFELNDEYIMKNAPYESNFGKTMIWTDEEGYIEKGVDNGEIVATVTAKQVDKSVTGYYRTTTSGEYTTFTGKVGDTYASNDAMKAIAAPETDGSGCSFSYWKVSRTDGGAEVARSYDTQFDLCLMGGDYYITPVYESQPRGSGELTVILDASAIETGEEDWLVWTWGAGCAGETVLPCDGATTFKGVHENVKFARVPSGTTAFSSNWDNVWNLSWELENCDNHNGETYHVTGWNSGDGHYFDGEWVATTKTPTLTLTHLDYSRNRWTDVDGSINNNGRSDILFTDYEIAIDNVDEKILYSDPGKYQVGLVFELCAQLPADKTFDENKDYNQYSDETNLKAAILAGANSYVYNPAKPSKTRSLQICEVDNSEMTNRNRNQFGKGYYNVYSPTSGRYTNSTYLMKVTPYLIVDGTTVYLGNSVYTCLDNEAKKQLAKDSGMSTIPVVTP